MDSIQPTSSTSDTQKQLGYTLRLSIVFAMILLGVSINMIRSGTIGLLWTMVPSIIAISLGIWYTNQNRVIPGSTLLITSIGILVIISPLLWSGLQPAYAIGALSLVGVVGLLTLPRKYAGRVLMAALIIAMISILVDLFAPANRLPADYPGIRWVITFFLFAILVYFFSREFVGLNIRTKIVLGILVTGGIALGILTYFALDQTRQVTNLLSARLDVSVSRLAEEQLTNRVTTLAVQANQSFDDVRQEVEGLSRNWASLQKQRLHLSQSEYWDGRKKLIRLNDGQYGNPLSDASSIYVPAKVTLNDDVYMDVNTSAYLDFYAPGVLATNSSLLAVYAIDTNGITRYYPNINLASILPPGFDATKRPYFEITSPVLNPRKRTRWTIPYMDATGGGLVVTVASPVYVRNSFFGVLAADMQLSNITEQVQQLNIGETGYAFMLDDAGRILSMPAGGYELFGLDPNSINNEEFFKQTLLGVGSFELQSIVRRMVAGGDGLQIINANGVDTYIAFSHIPASGYSLALVVPVSELQGEIIAARNETQMQVQSTVRLLAIILIALLVAAVLVSLTIGQIISGPVVRLTEVANQIDGGDLNARAFVTTDDEIGTLAASFNKMTSRLRESLQELEVRVQERTAELASASERLERRARQFESISQIASTIGSTRDLEVLLPQITQAISEKLGFYHTGIFLLDSRKEYAVLSAANSEGGKTMLANNHRLRVGETGIVGYVTSTGKPRVALSTGQDAVFFNNPFLPETRSEISLPLKSGDEIIGALDVQSTLENAFSQEDISILSTLADQVSIAIQNASQYEETRKALAESTATSRQFIKTGWQQFSQRQKIAGIRHSGARGTILYTSMDGNKDEVSRKSQSRSKIRGVSLTLPVKLRGEVIGTVDVHSIDNRKWDQDELDIVTAILERAAIAMENARLLAESQKRAVKESTIGEISTKISAQSNIEQLLKTAAQELNRALPNAEIAIQFNRDEELE